MIGIITPTGARQSQINLCKIWMQRQTYTGQVAWIIVDDAYPRTIENVIRPGWDVIKVYPEPRWMTGQNTQGRNIAAGVNTLLANFKDIEAIFIIEDDDYYRPVYLEKMMQKLNGFDLIGERNTIYYNVYQRRHFTNPNNIHSSLFQTAFTLNAIPVLELSLENRFIDCALWRDVKNSFLFNDGNLAIGMKGMPGRGGIGAGHSKMRSMPEDRDMNYLKSLIGQEDAKLYERYYGNFSMLKHEKFDRRGR